MGFFKKIGSAIKKNVSFKNLVKIATPVMGAIPFVGGTLQNVSQGLQQAHQEKKDAQAQQNAQAEANAEALRQQTLAYAASNASAVTNAAANMFGKSVTQGAYDGLSNGVKEGAANVGANVADLTIKAWFTKHWKHILIALSVIGVIYLIYKSRNKRTSTNRNRTRK